MFKFQPFIHRRFFTFLIIASLLGGDFLFAKGRKPDPSAPQPRASKSAWIHDGQSHKIQLYTLGPKKYLLVEDLAHLASAQLRWENVSEQACLSRVGSHLCFNWGAPMIEYNGAALDKKYDLLYTNRKLFVPVPFLTSSTFQKFSHTRITYKPKEENLVQNTPINLVLPPVENFGEYYRVSVILKNKIPYRILEQSQNRVWVRFPRGRFDHSVVLEGDSIVSQVEITQKRHSSDMVVYLGEKAGKPQLEFDEGSHSLAVLVPTDDQGRPKRRFPKHKVAPPASPKLQVRTNDPLPNIQPDKRVRTIVIDPGHGGYDSGAIGVRGTLEKDINLKVAKMLAKELAQEDNVRVIITRKGDEFLTLDQRTRIANKAKADMFISIHCNSSLSSKSNGFEVYILSPNASDEAAAAVARVENSVVQLEAKLGKSTSSRLNELLASMAVHDFINESSHAAAHICRSIKEQTSVDKTAVLEANFHVLRGAQMPGVLVELGYLSHPISEIQLRSSRYQSKLTKGIASGVLHYDQRRAQLVQSSYSKSN